MPKEDTEKETLDEILRVMDEHLAEINSKLDDIEILLFIIALPTIIGIVILVLFFMGLLTFPWRV